MNWLRRTVTERLGRCLQRFAQQPLSVDREHESSTAESQSIVNTELRDEVDTDTVSTKAESYTCAEHDTAQLQLSCSCPQCGGQDIMAQRVVEHQPCGCIKPLANFTTGHDITCPECETPIEQSSSEYRLITTIYDCQTCGQRGDRLKYQLTNQSQSPTQQSQPPLAAAPHHHAVMPED